MQQWKQYTRLLLSISLFPWLLVGTASISAYADSVAPVHLKNTLIPCSFLDKSIRGCDECSEFREFIGREFSTTLFFNNNIPGYPEVIFSNGASKAEIDTMGNLSINAGQATKQTLISAYMPNNFQNVQGLRSVLVFNVRGLKFTNHPESRDEVAARVTYELHYSVPSIDGYSKSLSAKWGYTDAKVTEKDGRTHYETSPHYDEAESVKYFHMTTPPRRKIVTCQALYVSWCGDGVTEKESPQMCQMAK